MFGWIPVFLLIVCQCAHALNLFDILAGGKYIYTLNESNLTVLPGGSPEENELPQVSTGSQMASAEDKTNVEAATAPSVEPESPGAMAALNLSIVGDTKLVRAYQQVRAKMRGKGNILNISLINY